MDFNVLLNYFYKDLTCNFNEIDLKKLIEIKAKAAELNKHFKNKKFGRNQTERHGKIMQLIHTGYKRVTENVDGLTKYTNTNTPSEKLLLYILSIDPELEALIIYNSYNTLREIEYQSILNFGIYDPNLAKIEKQYLKRFASTNQKSQINEEIERRAFK